MSTKEPFVAQAQTIHYDWKRYEGLQTPRKSTAMGIISAASRRLAHAADLQVPAMLSAARCLTTTLGSSLILHSPLLPAQQGGPMELALKQYTANQNGFESAECILQPHRALRLKFGPSKRLQVHKWE